MTGTRTTRKNTQYTPTLHAIDRARHRLGLRTEEATKWLDEAMRKATYVISQKVKGQARLVYEYKDVRLVVDELNRKIITIMPTVDVTILKPVIERERRRINREVTRMARELEAEQAELIIEYGTRALNKARAKNPKTRELIQSKMNVIQAEIDEIESKIARQHDRLTHFEKAAEAIM